MIAQHLLAKRDNNVEHGSTGKFRLIEAPVYCKPRTSQTGRSKRSRRRTGQLPFLAPLGYGALWKMTVTVPDLTQESGH